jgi:hypothetical protein
MSYVLVNFKKQEQYTVHPDLANKLKVNKIYCFNFPKEDKPNWTKKGEVLKKYKDFFKSFLVLKH